MLIILLGNYESRESLEHQLEHLYRLSKPEDKDTQEYSTFYWFIRESLILLSKEKYEDWLLRFKQELLREEKYELIHFLEI